MRSSHGSGPRRTMGAALDAPDTVATIWVVCACGYEQPEELALDEPLRAQLAEVSCARCGALGQGRLTQQARVAS